MLDALSIAATGMQAQQTSVDTIANNLVNLNTNGFKKARVGFADLMVRDSAATAADIGAQAQAPASRQVGAGVSVLATTRAFDMGELRRTDAPLDLAVRGEGFLEVALADGASAYTRAGTLKVTRDGFLATASGHLLRPSISVPDGAQELVVTPEGQVQARMRDQTQPTDLGQLDLVRFTAPEMLVPMGGNLYQANEATGQPMQMRPGEQGMGTLAQGYLEGSNVKMIDELVGLMLAQRGYEASVKVVQAADEMMGMVNNLRK